ncbi:hypothetical protein [Granulicella paludicola]|uniref:hypothetical protein n=1 Tax=Granulicella paludicola TaxID=474951 RepID=UPI0021DF6B24|nr:hypothetical protein [Granulicella paludicola]
MRRSAAILTPMLASTAVTLLAGCSVQMQRCIDTSNRVVEPAHCSVIPHDGYSYYYGGLGSYEVGSIALDGAFQPEDGELYSLTGTVREGFGTFFSEYAVDILFVAAIGIVIVTTGSFTS